MHAITDFLVKKVKLHLKMGTVYINTQSLQGSANQQLISCPWLFSNVTSVLLIADMSSG